VHAKFWKLGIFAVCLAPLAVVALRQRQANARLRAEATALRSQTSEVENLRAKRERLAARQLSPQELANLQEASLEVSRLRDEAAALRQQIELAAAAGKPAPLPTEPVPAAPAWSNSGRATSLDAFNTGVWAVMQGDTDTLAGLISFDAEGRAMVEALFERLPPESRATYGSAEKVFATLLAARLPQDLSSAAVIESNASGDENHTLRMRLQHANGRTKDTNFRFKRDAEGWQIVVPTTIVENYTAMLKGGLPSRSDPAILRAPPVVVDPR
jgi:hypothetical protein